MVRPWGVSATVLVRRQEYGHRGASRWSVRHEKNLANSHCVFCRAQGFEVKTVDGYQGREKDVIIFSAVRANREGHVGFLADSRRCNVALTRARKGLVVICHAGTLRHSEHWKSFLDWAQEMQLFVPRSQV